MNTFAPTGEQQHALELFATGKSLAIEAGAGTGKTSTLKLLAESTTRRGQYIAFNKAIVEEAKLKMPGSVACSTAHSLAYRNTVAEHQWMAERIRHSVRMKSTDIARRLRIDPIDIDLPDGTRRKLHASYLAGLTMRSVTRFCQSADQEPGEQHVPYIDGIDLPPGNRTNNRVVAKALVAPMRRACADITDPEGSLPFKHDHYLKMWHLSGPKINAAYILFDEAQDANPVLVDIVRQQAHAQLVWVGDSQQSIYGFTGAVNALETVGAEHTAILSQSFRFGPAIAAIANRCLEGLNAKLRLTGLDTIPSELRELDGDGRSVFLSRTNAAAVRQLLETLKQGRSAHLVGGGREVVDFAKAARDLQRDGFTSHPELACFQSWGEVQIYVEQDEQGDDLSLLVSLVDDFGADKIIDALERMPSEANADVILSTAHKAKGREWDSVKLADDFPATPKDEELRLLYVACTRAKLHLDITAIEYFNGGLANGDEHALELAKYLAANRPADLETAAELLGDALAFPPVPAPAPRADGWPSDRSSEMRSIDSRAASAMRLEVLRDLLTLTDAGIDLDSDALREMIDEVEDATTPVGQESPVVFTFTLPSTDRKVSWQKAGDDADTLAELLDRADIGWSVSPEDSGREPEAATSEPLASGGLDARPTTTTHRPAPDAAPFRPGPGFTEEDLANETRPVLGYCPHGVDLDRAFCDEGCRV